jgi:hypothetical protein
MLVEVARSEPRRRNRTGHLRVGSAMEARVDLEQRVAAADPPWAERRARLPRPRPVIRGGWPRSCPPPASPEHAAGRGPGREISHDVSNSISQFRSRIGARDASVKPIGRRRYSIGRPRSCRFCCMDPFRACAGGAGPASFYPRLATANQTKPTLLDSAGQTEAALHFDTGTALAAARKALTASDRSCASAAPAPPVAASRLGSALAEFTSGTRRTRVARGSAPRAWRRRRGPARRGSARGRSRRRPTAARWRSRDCLRPRISGGSEP